MAGSDTADCSPPPDGSTPAAGDLGPIGFTGKGGTGKTTCAAALACALAAAGRPARVLSLDPAHNLGDLLDRPVGDAWVRVTPALQAREADLEALMDARVRRAARAIRDRYRYLGVGSLDGLLGLLGEAPGAEEAAAAEVLATEVSAAARAGEVLVLDLPPSGQAWRLLSLPGLLTRWAETLAGLRRRILDRRRQLRHVLGEETPARAPDGGPLPEHPDRDPVLARLRAASAEQARVAAAFRPPTGGRVYAVLGPDPLSGREAERLAARLARGGIPVGGLVYNRLADPATPPGELLPDLPRVGLPECAAAPRGPAALADFGGALRAWVLGRED